MTNYNNTITIQACDYTSSYAAIYDSSYGAGFIFVDECDLSSDIAHSDYEPQMPSSCFLKRQERDKVLQIIISKA